VYFHPTEDFAKFVAGSKILFLLDLFLCTYHVAICVPKNEENEKEN